MIELKNIDISFSNQLIFENLTLIIKNKHTAILGENGSGKTTILKEMYKKYPNKIALFEPDFFLPPSIKISDVFKLIGNVEIDYDILEILGITQINKLCNELSDGERQRIILYCALASKKDYIFIDEPEKHLDLERTETVFGLISKSNKNIVVTTHKKDLAYKYFNLVMKIEDYSLKELKNERNQVQEEGIFFNDNVKAWVKQILFRNHFLFILIGMFLFLGISIFLLCRAITLPNHLYLEDQDTYISSISLYKDGQEISANVSQDSLLKNTNLFEDVFIDIPSSFSLENGFYNQENKLEEIYFLDSYKIGSTGVYVSKNLKEKINEVSFQWKKEIYYNGQGHQINIFETLPVAGYIDNEKSRVYCDYNLMKSFFNSYEINQWPLFDLASKDNDLMTQLIPSFHFSVLLKEKIPLEDIQKKFILNDVLSYQLTSPLIYKYRSIYDNEVLEKYLDYAAVIIISIVTFGTCLFFYKNQEKLYRNWYRVCSQVSKHSYEKIYFRSLKLLCFLLLGFGCIQISIIFISIFV